MLVDKRTDLGGVARMLGKTVARTVRWVALLLALAALTNAAARADQAYPPVLPGAALGFALAGLSLWAMGLGGLVAALLVAGLAAWATRGAPQREDAHLTAFYLIALAAGARDARLVNDPASYDLSFLDGVEALGVTAGASAPENLVETLLTRLAERFALTIEETEVTREDVSFKLPRELAG